MENLKGTKTEETPVKSKTGITGLFSSFGKLDTKKKIQYVAIILIAIIILTIYFSSFKNNAPDNNAPQPSATATQAPDNSDTEKQLEDTLSKIDGAGKVKVMITYESTPELVPAYSIDKQTSSTTSTNKDGSSTVNSENSQSDVVTIGGSSSGDSALVLRQESPEVKGVIVVAEGADNIEVKLNLLKAVETVLNVSPDKVDVYKMNNE